MFDEEAFAFAQRKVGVERLMFAVDYPYENSEVATEFLGSLHLSDEQRTLVSHVNAERLFRIPAEPK
jgi:5-carboxyvanillate decarboxylase